MDTINRRSVIVITFCSKLGVPNITATTVTKAYNKITEFMSAIDEQSKANTVTMKYEIIS